MSRKDDRHDATLSRNLQACAFPLSRKSRTEGVLAPICKVGAHSRGSSLFLLKVGENIRQTGRAQVEELLVQQARRYGDEIGQYN